MPNSWGLQNGTLLILSILFWAPAFIIDLSLYYIELIAGLKFRNRLLEAVLFIMVIRSGGARPLIIRDMSCWLSLLVAYYYL